MARLVLDQPTEDATGEIYLLTNLPAKVTAAAVVELYGNRWSIERAFSELTLSLRGEIETLGYPRAALLAYAIADVSSAGNRTCQKPEREPHQARRGSRPDLLANG